MEFQIWTHKVVISLKSRNFWQNIQIPILNIGYFGALKFQELEFFDHSKYNLKTSWPPQKINI